MKNYLLPALTLAIFLLHTAVYGSDPGVRRIPNPSPNNIVELSVVKTSDAPHTSTEHIYLLKAVNTSEKDVSFNLTATNTNCSGRQNVNFDAQVYTDASQFTGSPSSILSVHTIPAQGSVEFYVKLITPFGTPLNTWNCTEIKAVIGNRVVSDNIVIESFIPDPKDFR